MSVQTPTIEHVAEILYDAISKPAFAMSFSNLRDLNDAIQTMMIDLSKQYGFTKMNILKTFYHAHDKKLPHKVVADMYDITDPGIIHPLPKPSVFVPTNSYVPPSQDSSYREVRANSSWNQLLDFMREQGIEMAPDLDETRSEWVGTTYKTQTELGFDIDTFMDGVINDRDETPPHKQLIPILPAPKVGGMMAQSQGFRRGYSKSWSVADEVEKLRIAKGLHLPMREEIRNELQQEVLSAIRDDTTRRLEAYRQRLSQINDSDTEEPFRAITEMEAFEAEVKHIKSKASNRLSG